MDRQTYLDRKGERLVVQGFRHWLSGYELGESPVGNRPGHYSPMSWGQ